MPTYEVRIDETHRLVLAVVVGPIDAAVTQKLVAEAREASMASGLNLLYDMRAAVPGDMSSGALFWLPREVPQLQGLAARRTRAALLHPPEFIAMARYWENTFRNAGLSVKAFTDEDEARDWLAPSRPA